MKVESEIDIYEMDNIKIPCGDEHPKMIVKSHWNDKNMVVIQIGERKYTVVANHLRDAITNAINW